MVIAEHNGYKHALRFWEVYVDGEPLKPGESSKDFDSFWKKEYFRDQYMTKENYAESQSNFGTYAFVTSDGRWVETGTMGWFGMDNATAQSRMTYGQAFREYLKQAHDEDLLITIVDCHI